MSWCTDDHLPSRRRAASAAASWALVMRPVGRSDIRQNCPDSAPSTTSASFGRSLRRQKPPSQLPRFFSTARPPIMHLWPLKCVYRACFPSPGRVTIEPTKFCSGASVMGSGSSADDMEAAPCKLPVLPRLARPPSPPPPMPARSAVLPISRESIGCGRRPWSIWSAICGGRSSSSSSSCSPVSTCTSSPRSRARSASDSVGDAGAASSASMAGAPDALSSEQMTSLPSLRSFSSTAAARAAKSKSTLKLLACDPFFLLDEDLMTPLEERDDQSSRVLGMPLSPKRSSLRRCLYSTPAAFSKFFMPHASAICSTPDMPSRMRLDVN
mmetsp:Transcript_5378/g.15396  ORF Transcript_5378/g.15396 Transcript_5378/m.15396 type:complete len:326 (+) Transcript_5378:655-1632(+)